MPSVTKSTADRPGARVGLPESSRRETFRCHRRRLVPFDAMASDNGHGVLKDPVGMRVAAKAARTFSTTLWSGLDRLVTAKFGRVVPKAVMFEAHVAAVRSLRYADRTTLLRMEPHEP